MTASIKKLAAQEVLKALQPVLERLAALERAVLEKPKDGRKKK